MSIFVALFRGLRLGEAALFVASVALQARLCGPPRVPAARVGASAEAAPASDHPAGVESAPRPLAEARGGACAAALPCVAGLPLASRLASVLGGAVLSRALAPACGVLTAAHLALEGARWQLYGLYAATATAAVAERALGGCSRPLLRVAAGVVCACGTALTTLATLAFPWFKLLPPSGPFRVGRLTRVWTDDTRGAWVTPDKGSPRRLLVDVWFPASSSEGAPVGYMERVLARAMSSSFLGPRAAFVASHFAGVATSSRRGAVCAHPELGSRGFPVVVFSHGNVSTRVQNTSLLEELASHGYICCACDHPHDAAVVAYPDGSQAHFEWELPEPLDAAGVLAFRAAQVALRAGDVAFCLQALQEMGADAQGPLYGRVDCARASVVGHSFGGACAAHAARSTPQLRAAVLLDAWQWPLGNGTEGRPHADDGTAWCATTPLPCPALLFESDAFLGDRDVWCAYNSRMSSSMALHSAHCYKLVARVGHYEYTDMALTAPYFMRMCGLLALHPRELRAFQVYQSRLVLSFLNAHTQPVPRDQPPAPVAWAPPPSRFATLWDAEALAADVRSSEYTPRQRAAMKLLYTQVRRGEYEIWGVARDLDPCTRLPEVLVPVIHTHGLESMRRLFGQFVREEEVEAARAARRAEARAGKAHQGRAHGHEVTLLEAAVVS